MASGAAERVGDEREDGGCGRNQPGGRGEENGSPGPARSRQVGSGRGLTRLIRGRRLQGIVDRGGPLSPEVVCARGGFGRQGVGRERMGSGVETRAHSALSGSWVVLSETRAPTEWDELVPRADPVA